MLTMCCQDCTASSQVSVSPSTESLTAFESWCPLSVYGVSEQLRTACKLIHFIHLEPDICLFHLMSSFCRVGAAVYRISLSIFSTLLIHFSEINSFLSPLSFPGWTITPYCIYTDEDYQINVSFNIIYLFLPFEMLEHLYYLQQDQFFWKPETMEPKKCFAFIPWNSVQL